MISPEEAQKWLDEALQAFRPISTTADVVRFRLAKQALSELFHDVMGEVIGPDEIKDTAAKYTHRELYRDSLRQGQRTKAARYFPVDGGGKK